MKLNLDLQLTKNDVIFFSVAILGFLGTIGVLIHTYLTGQ